MELENELEKEVLFFLEAEKKQEENFLECFSKKKPELYINFNSNRMWFAGLKKYGSKWSEKVYSFEQEDNN